jgi:hypothetical protein
MKNFIRSLLGLSGRREPATSAPAAKATGAYPAPPGLEDEFARLDALDAGRGQEAVAVRLQPQVPLRDAESPRSWLGGGPAMADDIAWPEVDGVATRFLGQICCADLPADLWGGIGPRDGWLALFIHPTGVVVKHLATLGPWRERPGEAGDDLWLPYHWRRPKAGLAQLVERPRWPVDLVAVRPGEPDWQMPGSSKIIRELYLAGHDAAAPEHRPFDRNSTLEMLAMIEGSINDRMAAMVEREGKQATTDEQRSQSQAQRAILEAVLPPVVDLLARARALPAVSADEIADIMQQLSAIMVPDRAGGLASLTLHPAASWLWVWDFEERRLELAKQVYCGDPAALPEPARSYCEAIWKSVALGEMAVMGQMPAGNLDQFDPRSEVALVEFRSTDLIGWNFGDVSNLLLGIRRDDLTAGRFDRVTAETPN